MMKINVAIGIYKKELDEIHVPKIINKLLHVIAF